MVSDTRPIEEQMAAVGMYDTEHQCPTYAAVVLFGYKPRRFMPGLYVQYVCFKGEDVTSEVENEMQLEGNYCELLPRLESLLELSVIKKKPVFVSILREEMVSNYPYQAIRELFDYSGINVPLVAVCNVPSVAQCNVPPQKWLQ